MRNGHQRTILILALDHRTVSLTPVWKFLGHPKIGCRLLIVRSCARRNREPRQVRKEAAVTDFSLCHGATWLSAMDIQPLRETEDGE
jgi:hypothetical protein